MLITNRAELKTFDLQTRNWQGIPGIAVTKNGRIFVSFYSGKQTEDIGNYCVLMQSDDDGRIWSDPIAVIYFGENSRAYDPCLWIDGKDRLWFFASVTPEQKVVAYVCDNPDLDVLIWSDEKEVGGEVMLNKPTILKDGTWLMPTAVWEVGVMQASRELCAIYAKLDKRNIERKAFCYVSENDGKTFEKRGGITIEKEERSYEEHMFLELSDGEIVAYIRTKNGTMLSRSRDKGKTWGKLEKCGMFAPNTRIFVRRLSSGKMLMICHKQSDVKAEEGARKNLIAYLSEDEGITWKGGLLLDERIAVSYPDGQEYNGYIYIVYDRERKTEGEILLAKFTEQDVLTGHIISPYGRLKQRISSLT